MKANDYLNIKINIKNKKQIIKFIKELEKLGNKYGYTFINGLIKEGYITISVSDLLELEYEIER